MAFANQPLVKEAKQTREIKKKENVEREKETTLAFKFYLKNDRMKTTTTKTVAKRESHQE